jgi:EpsI family protein
MIAAAAAVILNFVRVFIVVYLAYLTEMQHPFVDDHLMLGWYLFAGMMIILLIIDTRWGGRKKAQAIPQVQQVSRPQVPPMPHMNFWLALVLSALLIIPAPAAINRINSLSSIESHRVAISAPAGRGGWQADPGVKDNWLPVYHGALTAMQVYAKQGKRIYLFLGYYPQQKQGEELINARNHIHNDKVWRARYPRARLYPYSDTRLLEQILERGGTEDRLVWYWYRVGGMWASNKYIAKLLQVIGRMRGRPEASVIAVATELDELASAREVLDDFISSMQLASLRSVGQAH